MPARERIVDRGRAEGRAAVMEIARELKLGRTQHSLAQREVAKAAGISQATYSRIERGRAPSLTVLQAASLLAAVGLKLHCRAYPVGQPLRDDAHTALLGRLRGCLNTALIWRAEVPVAARDDLRSWDATIRGSGWVVGVEAEMRPTDLQALRRRMSLKQRDGNMPNIILLLAATRHNRDLVRNHAADLRDAFPLPARRALELLRAGEDPGASAIILL